MTDDLDLETTDSGPSRRQLIKTAAVGGALVWTAPVISSVLSPAAAASAAGCGEGWSCGDPNLTFCSGDCICYAETKPGSGKTGKSFCGSDFGCGTGQEACAPDGTCPPGYQCQSGCCGDYICAPLCSSKTESARISGPKNSG
jgi:hypothetical protein